MSDDETRWGPPNERGYGVTLRCGHALFVPFGQEWEPKLCPTCNTQQMVLRVEWIDAN